MAQTHGSALCARIEQRLSGQAALFGDEGKRLPLAVERQAERIAARRLAKQGTPGGGGGDVQSVDVDSLSPVRPRSVGVEQVGLWALHQAGLEERLQTASPSSTFIKITYYYSESEDRQRRMLMAVS